MNILVIDSDRVSQRLAGSLIKNLCGLLPTVASSVEAAPIGDWSLVLVTGDAAHDLQALRRTLGKRTRLVAMIVQDCADARAACLQAGADEVLVKPLTRDALVRSCEPAVLSTDDYNRAAWAELRELFGATGVARLCATLVGDLPVQQAHLADAIRDHDLAALKRIAHALRGVSLQLGATALAGQWALAEQAAAAGDDATALRLAVELIERHAALVARLDHESHSV